MKQPRKFRLRVNNWLCTVMWGAGFGFRLRIHRWIEGAAFTTAVDTGVSTVECTLKFKPHEWRAIAAAADREGSTTWNFMKRAAIAAARVERRAA